MRIPDFLRKSLLRWHMRHTTRSPDFVIGSRDSAYLNRWYLFPRNRWFNIYLHEILRDDEDRALHDHMYAIGDFSAPRGGALGPSS